MGFRPFNKKKGTTNEQFSDPKYQAPKGANLKFKFYCTQPQNLIMKVNGRYQYDLEITASNDWQEMIISSDKLKNIYHKHSLKNWSEAQKIQILPKVGADITKVIFAKFSWSKTNL